MSKITSLPRLFFLPSTQNSRVDYLSRASSSSTDSIKSGEISPDLIESVVNRCYKQIFFHAMNCDREIYLESQLRQGSITVRDFIKGLLLSERFYRAYVQCNSNERIRCRGDSCQHWV